MIRSPVSSADGLIRGTIERYQETFNSGDRDGWLALFAENGLLEDPAGSDPEEVVTGLRHSGTRSTRRRPLRYERSVRMIQGPAVCGLEAAWAFELRIPRGDKTAVVEIIDRRRSPKTDASVTCERSGAKRPSGSSRESGDRECKVTTIRLHERTVRRSWK